jgi:hypothetical protein
VVSKRISFIKLCLGALLGVAVILAILSPMLRPMPAGAHTIMTVTGLSSSLSLGTWSGELGNIEKDFSLCVYHDDSANYTLEATGSSESGTFYMSNSSNHLKYHVKYTDTDGSDPESFVELSPGDLPRNFTNARSGGTLCSGSTNPTAVIRIIVNNADMQGKPGNRTYSATLTLVFSPRT